MGIEISEIKKKLIEKFTPTKSELFKLNKITNDFLDMLKKRADNLGLHYEFIEPQGSTGKKQTQLIGASDIDIFLGLSPDDYRDILKLEKVKRKQSLNKIFLNIISDLFIPVAKELRSEQIKIFYAEHPYLNLKKDNYDIDLVGCFALTEEEIFENGPITAVDRTPLHTKKINEDLNSEQKNDVRLLKAFCQAALAYGDKSAVGQFGFTGYSTEVLILYFGSLENTFENFSSVLENPIDFFGRTREELLKIPKFKNDYFIMIDPIDKNRNVASSISKRSYKFVNYRIKEFLKSPSEDFFIFKPVKILTDEEISIIQNKTWVLEFKSDNTVHYTELRDKLYSLCMKLKTVLEKEPTGDKRFGKSIHTVYFNDDCYSIILYNSKNNISPTYLRKGPSLSLKKHVKKFKEKNPKHFTKNGYVWTEVKRDYLEFSHLISDFVKHIKIKGLNLINQSPTGINIVGKKGLSILYKYILPLEEEDKLKKSKE
ncbi:MAG: hypothetical protein ACTSRG_00585 [Candidatus Helarchaeota archaeon]